MKLSHRKFCSLAAAAAFCIGLSGIVPAGAGDLSEAQLTRQISQAEYHVREFEKEVELQRGGDKQIYRSKKDALDRVQKLKQEYPNDPRVELLFQRTKTALMKSKGDYKQVDPLWTKYKRDEAELVKTIAGISEKEWNSLLAARKDRLENEFPAPDIKKIMLPDIKGKYVLLKDVIYPNNQFYGATGEFIWHGKPSSGYYYVEIDGRDWLGPYEAIKRYRRSVDSSLEDNLKFDVLAVVDEVTSEIPSSSQEKKGSYYMGWVVKPVAVYVPGHVLGVYDEKRESSGVYAGEEQVDKIKEGWYTYKSVPDDVTPEKLMEIFMMAIKEKNYDLYVACINPRWTSNPNSNALLRYHWDLHQGRFHKEYVHATFDKAHPIEVIKGFKAADDQENFFLDDDQREILKKTQGDLVEMVTVDSRAFDENGKQVGSPHPHKLIRTNGGRWYIDDYTPRF
ncbi:MAG: hypothetical protein IJ523_00720 [Succinivibrionaceae bacterium]|nr:hypothetical protein [Succinivibrionaceae bacterium]